MDIWAKIFVGYIVFLLAILLGISLHYKMTKK